MYNTVNTLKLKSSGFVDPLKNIPDTPGCLYIKGTPLSLVMQLPRVAVVGSRKMDSYGRYVTAKLAGDLAKKGIVIISGLALGVDALAHRSALDARGVTVAVLPSGIEQVYPGTNARLAEDILQLGGTVLSETDGIYAPHEYDFLKRNRLISGLSQVVIVTQAAARSGSLNTARHALEQGRVVMAVPGPINNPLSAGTNNLLKMGAHPVTDAQDVLHIMGLTELPRQQNLDLLARTADELTIIKALQQQALSTDQLVATSGLSYHTCITTLTVLEIENIISVEGNIWSLC